jgi:hypothetical protein
MMVRQPDGLPAAAGLWTSLLGTVRGMFSEEQLGEIETALTDANIPSERCRFYAVEGSESGNMVGAHYWIPQVHIAGDCASDCLTPEQLADADSETNQQKDRIAVWTGVELPLFGARVRHELHHAEQNAAYGDPIGSLYFLIRSVLGLKVGGRDGCWGMFHNAMPFEQDANAAAAVYLRTRHPESVAALCRHKDHQALACSNVGPEPMETLPRRMIAFAFQFRGLCDQYASEAGFTFRDILAHGGHIDGLADFWDTLTEGVATDD